MTYIMQLRSGKVYDPSFPARAREFMRFGNPKFAEIWDSSIYVFHIHCKNKNDHKEVRRAAALFHRHVLAKVREELGYYA